jgi:geranylgeranyl diphosphate synthase type II
MQNRTLEELREIFSESLAKEAEKIGTTNPTGLYEPIKYTLDAGGKRLRPVLVLLTADMFSDNISHAIPAATAIEIFHNFTLLHDDVMDNATLRRGNLTVHEKYSENTAILSGDAMSILAYRYLGESPAILLPELLSLFTKTALEVCEGQQYDMEFEEQNNTSVDDYMKMIRLKTAVLIACSLKMGAIIANASDNDANLLYEFGINIGLAFQLQDDWLDVYGDPKVFGKKIGGDIRSNKKTFLLLKSLELSNEQNRQELLKWITSSNADNDIKVAEVTRIFNDTGVDRKAKELMLEYHKKAINCLNKLEIPESKKEALLNIADKVINRIS